MPNVTSTATIETTGPETEDIEKGKASLSLLIIIVVVVVVVILIIRASVDALCRDGAVQISLERVKRGRITRQGTRS